MRERVSKGRISVAVAACCATVVLSAVALSSAADPGAEGLGKSTVAQRIVPDSGPGYRRLSAGPGEARQVREAGFGSAKDGRAGRRTSLIYFAQLSDFQLADEESPARVEFSDPFGDPFTAAWRPGEALNPQIDDAMIRQIDSFAGGSPIEQGNGARRPLDLTIDTGDSADNQQLNETQWVRTLLEGGSLDPNSGIDPTGYVQQLCPPGLVPGAAEAARYTGVQDYNDYSEGPNPQFYDPNSPRGEFAGFPAYPGLMDRAQQPFQAAGLSVPSYVSFGNHDGLVQGNQANTRAVEDVALGCLKAAGPTDTPANLASVLGSLNPATLQAAFASDPSKTFFTPPDPKRQAVSKVQYKQVFKSGTQADGHGFKLVSPAQDAASGGAAGYYSFSPRPGIRMIALDTVSEGGVTGPSADGNIDDPQFRWLEAELKKATQADELVILFSHHAIQSLTADVPDEAAPSCTSPDVHGHDQNPGCDVDPRSSQPIHLGDDMTELLHRFPHVVAWVAGHSHVNDITPFRDGKGGGFWLIRTAAEADWPQQSRLVELFDNHDGTLSIFGTILDHASAAPTPPSGTNAISFDKSELAAIGRTLAYNDPQTGARACTPNPCGEGKDIDRNVELLINDPRTRTGEGGAGNGGSGTGPLLGGACANRRLGTKHRDRLLGTPAGDRLRAFGGKDVLKGRGGRDCLLGGAGADALSGGRGADRISGGPGNDRVRSRDGRRDVVRCGRGHRDVVIADRRDRVKGCEKVRRPRRRHG